MHICVSKLIAIGLWLVACPAPSRYLAGIFLIRPLGTNFSEIVIELYTFSFKKMHLKMLSGKWLPFCQVLNVSTHTYPRHYAGLHNICLDIVLGIFSSLGNHNFKTYQH